MEERTPVQVEGIPIIVENVLSVVDVHRSNVDLMVIRWLENSDHRIYSDNLTSLREHLYAIAAVEARELEDALPTVRNQVEQLKKLAEANDASYVRFIS